MTITYHSQNRKELVKAISEIIGIPAVYQFMPTCAYQIGECYTVTKAGDLEISDQADRKETERLLAELANRGYAVPDTSEPESKGLTVQMPSDFFTEHTLGNLQRIGLKSSLKKGSLVFADLPEIAQCMLREEIGWHLHRQAFGFRL